MSGVLDALSIAVVVVIFALIFINGTILVSSIGTAFINSGAITNTMSTYGVFNSAINSIYVGDSAVILLYFGLWIVSILAASYLESETINLPLTIFMGIITIFVSFIISNAMHAVLANPLFSGVIAHFGMTQFLMANLGAFTALFVFIYALVILARPTFTGNAPGSSSGEPVISI